MDFIVEDKEHESIEIFIEKEDFIKRYLLDFENMILDSFKRAFPGKKFKMEHYPGFEEKAILARNAEGEWEYFIDLEDIQKELDGIWKVGFSRNVKVSFPLKFTANARRDKFVFFNQ